jgi:hypothetical protein
MRPQPIHDDYRLKRRIDPMVRTLLVPPAPGLSEHALDAALA